MGYDIVADLVGAEGSSPNTVYTLSPDVPYGLKYWRGIIFGGWRNEACVFNPPI